VQAIQRGRCIFTTSLSFQHNLEFGVPVIHHQSKYPGQPMPRDVGAESFPNSPFSADNQDEQEVPNGIKVKIIPPEKGKHRLFL
jgi:acyl-CoA thioesterase